MMTVKETASLFATEIDRYLNGDAVEACPPTLSYRFHKFVKRNKAAVLIALLFLALFCLTAWKWWDELKARRQAVSAGNELLEERNLAQTLLEQSETNLYYSQIAQAELQHQLHNPPQVALNLELAEPEPGARDRRGWEWGYLNRQLKNDLMTITAGTPRAQWINDIAFSADGRFFATAAGAAEFMSKPVGVQGVVKIFNAASGRPVFEISDPTLMSVYAIALSSDGNILATLDRDWVYAERSKTTPWQVRLWDVRTQTVLRGCPVQHESRYLRFSPDGTLLAANSGSNVRVWRVANGEHLQDFSGNGFQFSDDSKRIVVAGDGSQRPVIEFDPLTGEVLKERAGMASGQPDPTGRYAVRKTSQRRLYSHTIFVDEAATGKLIHELRHQSTVWDFDFHPRGQWLASGGGDGVVHVWDMGSGILQFDFAGHNNHVSAVAFSPRGDRLVSGDWNGTVKVWDLTRHPDHLVVFDRYAGSAAVDSMAFEPGNTRLVSAWQFFNSHVYLSVCDVNTGHAVGYRGNRIDVLNRLNVPAQITAFNSPATRLLAVTQSDQTKLKLFDVADGSEILQLSGHSKPIRFVSISDDGRRAAGASPAAGEGEYGELIIWNVGQQDECLKLTAPNFRPIALALDGRGRVALVAGSSSGQLQQVERESSVAIGEPAPADPQASFLEAWDLIRKQRMYRMVVDSSVTEVAFSPEDDRLATAQRAGSVTIRQTETGAPVQTAVLPGGLMIWRLHPMASGWPGSPGLKPRSGIPPPVMK